MEIALLVLIAAVAALSAALAAAICVIKKLRKHKGNGSELDVMTGLPDRESFLRLGNDVIARYSGDPRDLALFVFDVDELGMINVLYGMERGDDVLRAFAAAVRDICAGGVAGRVNSDDFAVLTRLDDGGVDGFAERFEKDIRSRIGNAAFGEHVKYRAGVCRYDGHDDVHTMLSKANLCLMMSKSDSVTEFSGEMENRMVENEIMRSEMLDALDRGEFELYYQPKVSFKNGNIRGVEALIRWHHPVKGFVPPSEFIPLAEQFGIITKIDEWGLITACRQGKKWQEMGLEPVTISVNMSQAQFTRTDVYATVVKALEETGFDPRYLEIEVTETMAMTDVEHTVSVLERIHDLGVHISMDDFGTGYSSLASLRSIPFDVLKIDRSLVCDVSDNDAARRITGAIVAMGKALHLIVIAEGVESFEQCRFLTEAGCDLAQGFFYSKPRPASEIEDMLEFHQAS